MERGARGDRAERGHRADYQGSHQRRYNDEFSEGRMQPRDLNAPLRGHRGSRGSYSGSGIEREE